MPRLNSTVDGVVDSNLDAALDVVDIDSTMQYLSSLYDASERRPRLRGPFADDLEQCGGAADRHQLARN